MASRQIADDFSSGGMPAVTEANVYQRVKELAELVDLDLT